MFVEDVMEIIGQDMSNSRGEQKMTFRGLPPERAMINGQDETQEGW